MTDLSQEECKRETDRSTRENAEKHCPLVYDNLAQEEYFHHERPKLSDGLGGVGGAHRALANTRDARMDGAKAGRCISWLGVMVMCLASQCLKCAASATAQTPAAAPNPQILAWESP